MWHNIVIFSSILMTVLAEITVPGIDRTLSEGVKSVGYKIVYGDQDLNQLNEVVDDLEKDIGKSRINLNDVLPPLPAEDVKCLMSVDRFCSNEMGKIKGIIIEAIRNDCEQCTNEQKDQAGKVIASMMAHDSVAWKLFLTRYILQSKPQEEPPKEDTTKFIRVGKAEAVIRSHIQYIRPGVQVRVKRYLAEKV